MVSGKISRQRIDIFGRLDFDAGQRVTFRLGLDNTNCPAIRV